MANLPSPMDDEEETGGIQEILRQVDPRAGVDLVGS